MTSQSTRNIRSPRSFSDAELHRLMRSTFRYFWEETNPENSLIPDNDTGDVPASIAGVGLALATYPAAVERGFVRRADARDRALATLQFFWSSPQSGAADATGYRGFYYHFLDVQTGRRAWQCELSTIDSTILIAGVLTAAAYFDRSTTHERELRRLARALYRRMDWRWAQNGGPLVTHGWKPETGFLPYHWEGYNEALLVYVLGLGSPTHALPARSYEVWTSTYRWRKFYGHEYLFGGPLFMHQLSHIWIDFRGIQDHVMREHGIDYFENSRRATYVQQEYARRNPKQFREYGEYAWGITASNGPGPATYDVDGRRRRFLGYYARGVPTGPDDGTLAPWGVVASLPFAPEIVLPTVEHFKETHRAMENRYGLACSVNPTFPRLNPRSKRGTQGWVSTNHFSLDQGPVILMIENYRSGLIWRLMRGCPYIVRGLKRAGFRNGWLSKL